SFQRETSTLKATTSMIVRGAFRTAYWRSIQKPRTGTLFEPRTGAPERPMRNRNCTEPRAGLTTRCRGDGGTWRSPFAASRRHRSSPHRVIASSLFAPHRPPPHSTLAFFINQPRHLSVRRRVQSSHLRGRLRVF